MVLLDLGYQVLMNSWLAAAGIVKYVLLVELAFLLKSKDFSFERFRDNILSYSRTVLFSFYILGVFLTFSGIDFRPFASSFSFLVAFLYLGFLFWSY